MKGKLVERQTIVTWHKPEEQMPPNEDCVIATISGRIGNATFDHAFVVASWDEADGWFFEGLDRCDDITVLAWCDLEPYGG